VRSSLFWTEAGEWPIPPVCDLGSAKAKICNGCRDAYGERSDNPSKLLNTPGLLSAWLLRAREVVPIAKSLRMIG
jgi:hypothetical protein